MASYGELKTEIADELARGDLSGVIPRFVRQATQRLNRQWKVRTLEAQRRPRAFGNGTRYLPAPVNTLEIRRLWNVITSETTERHRDTEITQVPPQRLNTRASGGRLPSFFALHRGDPPEIEFDVELADDREVEMVYTVKYADFVDDADTNWLLDNHGDLYLYGALIPAHLYLRNPQEAATYATALGQTINELYEAGKRLEYMQPIAPRAAQPVF